MRENDALPTIIQATVIFLTDALGNVRASMLSEDSTTILSPTDFLRRRKTARNGTVMPFTANSLLTPPFILFSRTLHLT